MRFDSPEEVLKRVIDFRTNKIVATMGEAKELMITYCINMLRKIRVSEDVIKKNGNKTITMVGDDK